MEDRFAKTLIVIAGPTASGKTAAAIKLAQHFNTVILSADSRQFYRELSIGSAKPGKAELAAAPHYFINSISVTDYYTAGDYEQQALALLKDLFQKHDKVILAGGSGLFIKAVCQGFNQFPDVSPATRERLNNELEKDGLDVLKERLKITDPVYYCEVDLNNPQRVIRALEVYESSGKPYSSYRGSMLNRRPFGIVKLGLNTNRKALYRHIDQRVDKMIADGLLDEVRSLAAFSQLNALKTVGYAELFGYLNGKTDLSTAIALIKQNTRRFAKRQLTWFSKDKEIKWFDAADEALIVKLIDTIDNAAIIRQ